MTSNELGPLVFAATTDARALVSRLTDERAPTLSRLLDAGVDVGLRIDVFSYVATDRIARLFARARQGSRLLLRHPGGIDLGLAKALSKERPPDTEIRVVESLEGRTLHAKIYVLHQSDSRLVVVGSSNATESGLSRNIETNVAVLVSGPAEPGDPSLVFERLWLASEAYDPEKHRPEPLVRHDARGLFDYQLEALRALDTLLPALTDEGRPPRQAERVPGCMVALPTAAGKTVVATRFVLSEVLPLPNGADYRRVLWIAETREQIRQACDALVRDLATAGRPPRVMVLDNDWKGPLEGALAHDVIFATRKLLASRLKKTARADLPTVDLIVVDEAHHAFRENTEYPAIFDRIPHRARLGISATPHRHPVEDDPGLYCYFNPSPDRDAALQPVFERSLDALKDAAHRGVRIFARAVDHSVRTGVELDIANVHNDEELRTTSGAVFAAKARVSAVVRAFDVAIHAPALFFAVDVADANAITKALLATGVRAQAVHSGETVAGQLMTERLTLADRRRAIDALVAGDLQALVSVEVFIEGVDIPPLQSVFIARPTFSARVFLQMRGRGLRGPATGGTDTCHIIDFVDDVRGANTTHHLQDVESALRHERGITRVQAAAARGSRTPVDATRWTIDSFLDASNGQKIDIVVQTLREQPAMSLEDGARYVYDRLGGASSQRRTALLREIETALRAALASNRAYRRVEGKNRLVSIVG